jgi:hypothetical protein
VSSFDTHKVEQNRLASLSPLRAAQKFSPRVGSPHWAQDGRGMSLATRQAVNAAKPTRHAAIKQTPTTIAIRSSLPEFSIDD